MPEEQEELEVRAEEGKELTDEEKAARGDFIEEEEEKEEKEEKEINPETLKKIAGEEEEEEKKPIMIPKSRFDEAVEKERERVRTLELELEEERKKKPEHPKEEPNADRETLRDLVKKRNAALVDGDTEAAANLDLEIIEKSAALSSDAIKKIKDEVRAEMKAESEAESNATLQERLASIAEEAYKIYSFLNPEADIVNNKAIKEIKAKRDEYYNGGMPIEEALKKAVEDVGPKYLGGKEADKGKEREKETKLRNADAAGKQPPNLNSSGSQMTGEERDPSRMSRAEYNKWWDSLSESERKKYQGDIA